MRIEVSNTGAQELDELSLRLMELDFPSAPNGGTLEAGMFGFGFKGTTHPLYQYPSVADPQFVAPIVGVDFKTGALNFCSDDLKCSLSRSEEHTSELQSRRDLVCRLLLE